MVHSTRSSSKWMEHSEYEAKHYKIDEIPKPINFDNSLLKDSYNVNKQNTICDMDIVELSNDIDEQVIEITNEGESIIQDGIVSVESCTETNLADDENELNLSELHHLNKSDQKVYLDIPNDFIKLSPKHSDHGYDSMASPQSVNSFTSDESYWDDRLLELFPNLEF